MNLISYRGGKIKLHKKWAHEKLWLSGYLAALPRPHDSFLSLS